MAAEHCDSTEALQLLLQISPPHVSKRVGSIDQRYALDILLQNYTEPRKSFDEMFECLLQVSRDVTVIGTAIFEIIDCSLAVPLELEFKESQATQDYLFGLMARLIKQYPAVVAEYRGRTLLHIAAGTLFKSDEECIKVLQLLFDASPEQAIVRTAAESMLPVHLAAREGNLCALKFLLERCPETLLMNGNDDWNVLHYVVKKPLLNKDAPVNLEAVKYLSERYPELQYQRNNDGYTPLLKALQYENIPNWDVIEMLLKADPDVAKVPVIFTD